MYLSSLHSLRRNGSIELNNPKAINVGLRLPVVGGGVGNQKGTIQCICNEGSNDIIVAVQAQGGTNPMCS
jgi:hypothetical protein